VQQSIDVAWLHGIEVNSMYGIEIEEFPARIAETALWLVDHQVNLLFERELGQYRPDLPLVVSPNIRNDNALAFDWNAWAPRTEIKYVVGNPPFVGKKRRSADQARDLELVCSRLPGYKELDYVACWYVKAADYIQGTAIRAALVSTNSISQGEQVPILWPHLFAKGITVNFAHQTFRWDNDAKGVAHVYTIIAGFSLKEQKPRRLFMYENPDSEPVEVPASTINAYLTDGPMTIVCDRKTPLQSGVPPIVFGSMPNDGGNLILSDAEYLAVPRDDDSAVKYIAPLLSAEEYLNGKKRWCLWLVDASASEIRGSAFIKARVSAAAKHRSSSTRPATRKAAATPYLFAEIRQPGSAYILVPRHSSEHRAYIPMSVFGPDHIVSDSCAYVSSDDLYVFGILMSSMHMAWVRYVCGRIKSDYRYSNEVVYNTFPWPNPSETQEDNVRLAAKSVLDARKGHEGQSLADLYDVNAMPKRLRDAHRDLDRAAEKCYRGTSFAGEDARFVHLLNLYKGILELPLVPTVKPTKRGGR